MLECDDRSTIATWVHDAGYRTVLLGKYLNGYEGPYLPPGWDRWFATFVNGGFYDCVATIDGITRAYGADPADYETSVLAAEAADFIWSTPADVPLFLYFAPHAPHEPATAAPGDRRQYEGLPAWRPESFNEAGMCDRPAYIRDRASLDAVTQARIDEFRRSQYRSLLAVDRAVATIVDALADAGRLANTLIVFTSDNGFLWGEHRWAKKLVPYEESIRVPFIVRFDALIPSARTERRLVLNIDLAPTFAELANVSAPGAEGGEPPPALPERTRAMADGLPAGAHADG